MTGTSPAQPAHPPAEPWPAAFTRDHRFAGEEASVGLARRKLRQDLEAVDGVDVFDAAVLVSEAVTNAVQHSRSKLGGTVDMTVMVMCSRVRVEVSDAGPLNGNRPAVLNGAHSKTRGRGLQIMSELATAWGWAPRHTPAGCGTVVWFELLRR